MEKGLFRNAATTSTNDKWVLATHREYPLYEHSNEIRDDFERDYTRILHSLGYRRLKHKTQVFFNTQNDHICTRLEHVNHVESVSYTIANFLGLNTALTKAISSEHDIGHTPFGHEGERVLKSITEGIFSYPFFHERNSLNFIDNIELVEAPDRKKQNLDLTYAVRDGIISHCGEINENALIPRDEEIDLWKKYDEVGKYMPFTWEGCVVKISDKISYLGRDIEDAVRLNFIGHTELRELVRIARKYQIEQINTTVLINTLITDLCENSTPEKGLMLSDRGLELLDTIKDYNIKYIYNNSKFIYYKKYVHLIIESIFSELEKKYQGADTFSSILCWKNQNTFLSTAFSEWLALYCNKDIIPHKLRKISASANNRKIYNNLSNKEDYLHAVVDYIAGMTDQYAIKAFDSLTSF